MDISTNLLTHSTHKRQPPSLLVLRQPATPTWKCSFSATLEMHLKFITKHWQGKKNEMERAQKQSGVRLQLHSLSVVLLGFVSKDFTRNQNDKSDSDWFAASSIRFSFLHTFLSWLSSSSSVVSAVVFACWHRMPVMRASLLQQWQKC